MILSWATSILSFSSCWSMIRIGEISSRSESRSVGTSGRIEGGDWVGAEGERGEAVVAEEGEGFWAEGAGEEGFEVEGVEAVDDEIEEGATSEARAGSRVAEG